MMCLSKLDNHFRNLKREEMSADNFRETFIHRYDRLNFITMKLN